MSKITVELVATSGVFRGLASQNLLFHQCVAELVDNSIAAHDASNGVFRVDIILQLNVEDDQLVDVYVVDHSGGMSVDVLKMALQLGESATTSDRLNEHGFGLKNSLATLSDKNGPWTLWTKEGPTGPVISASGPFQPTMVIDDDADFPEGNFLPPDPSTIVKVTTKLTFLQSVQGRGAPARDLVTLRSWLIEHLGVLYRGYLEQDKSTFEPSGRINVSVSNNIVSVPVIPVPMGSSETKRFDVEIAGHPITIEYIYGTLDEEKRDELVRGQPARFYYQKNQPTQGVDIRLGKRTIATRQLETIWKTDDNTTQVSRHNRFNDFTGEILIPDPGRGILTTTNNKTDFNLEDTDWSKIFDYLNSNFKPIANLQENTEKGLRDAWMALIKGVNPEDKVQDDRSVWGTGTRVDVFRETRDGQLIIYELKVGRASPLHLYQLKMYWDGLAIEGVFVDRAILLCEDFSTTVEEMANQMNKLPAPDGSKEYRFTLEKHAVVGLK